MTMLFYKQVEKQCAHFFGVTISEEQAQSGIVVRVSSAAQSKFKVPIMLPFIEKLCARYDGEKYI